MMLPPTENQLLWRVLASCPCLRLKVGAVRLPGELPTGALLVVERGAVAVVCSPPLARRMMVVAVAAPDDWLAVPGGEQRLLALQDTALRVITTDVRRRLLQQPEAAAVLLSGVLAALREREESLAQFANVAHIERLRAKLLQLARISGRLVDGGVQVELPLTHALLGQMVGSARETVSGAVRALEQEGFLVRDDGRYRLIPASRPRSPKRDSV